MYNDLSLMAASEKEIRIKIALWAYAYEIEDKPIVDDATFDSWCAAVDLEDSTDRPDLDEWFKANFSPDTGQWIHSHPELARLKQTYENVGWNRT